MNKSKQQDSSRQQVSDLVIKFLTDNPNGKHYSDIQKYVAAKSKINQNTINGSLQHFKKLHEGSKLSIPDRGLWLWEIATSTRRSIIPPKKQCKEDDFYPSFAQWLMDNDYCTDARKLGGGSQKVGKWGTPDVVGVYKAQATDLYKFSTEVVTAEIKIDDTTISPLVTAFGQSCAYRLFSHKVFIVVPETAATIDRLKALCTTLGIGLITFDANNIEHPDYKQVLVPLKNEPDFYYLNEFAKHTYVSKLVGSGTEPFGNMF